MRKKTGILWRQILLYSSVILIFMLIMIFISYSYILNVSTENATIAQEQLTNATMEQVDGYFDHIMLIATQISHDSEVIRILDDLQEEMNASTGNIFAEDSPQRQALYNLVINHNRSKAPAYQIAIYNLSGDYLCLDLNPQVLEIGSQFTLHEMTQFTLTSSFLENDLEYLMGGPTINPFDNESPNQYVMLQMPIKSHDETEIYGFVEVHQPADTLYELLEMEDESGINAYLYNCSEPENIRQAYPSDHKLEDLNTDSLFITTAESRYDWPLTLIQSRTELLAPYRAAMFYQLLGMVALTVVLFLCVYLIARYTNKPLLQLREKVRDTSLDHESELRISENATEEIKELDHTFDQMLQRLRVSVTLEKKAYLNALQAQMNPHFLYNCLSTISGMCIIGRTQNIPKFCNRLAAILRYETTYDDKAVTLDDELKNVTNYLELMKLRYENDFEYQLYADESLLHLPMPRLMLQPIVENCFEHGFRDVVPPWCITIEAFREEQHWCISICDNGCGFGEAQLAQLRQQVDTLSQNLSRNYAELQIGGLGLINTIIRLRLVTDGQMDYSITPGTPNGTIVTLKGRMNDESPDRGR